MISVLLALAAFQTIPSSGLGGPLLWADTFQAPVPQAGDQFGRGLATGGERAVISAWRRDSNTGGADVYRWSGSELIHEATLTPSDAAPGSMCGFGVDINQRGDLVVLSATGDTSQGTNSGAVYVFRRRDTAWIEEAKLLAPGGREGDAFGDAVAVGTDVIVVGATGVDIVPPGFYAAGAVYVFEYDTVARVWDAGQTVLAPDPDGGDRFGQEISLEGDTFAVGCPGKDIALGDNAGAVYVYGRQGGRWTLEEQLVAAGSGAGTGFGRAVALHGDTLVASSATGAMTGRIHVLRRGALGWTEAARFSAPTSEPFDFFGESLALHGQCVLASARKLGGVDAPVVHVHRLDGGAGSEWIQSLTQALPAGSHLSAGCKVAISDRFALIGEALHGQNLGTSPSQVEVFRTALDRWLSGPIRAARR